MLAYLGDVDLLDLIEYVRHGLKSYELASTNILLSPGRLDGSKDRSRDIWPTKCIAS